MTRRDAALGAALVVVLVGALAAARAAYREACVLALRLESGRL